MIPLTRPIPTCQAGAPIVVPHSLQAATATQGTTNSARSWRKTSM
jgi:hypothetical protein